MALVVLWSAACADSGPIHRLEVGSELSFDMAPDTIRRFSLIAAAGDFVWLTVEQDAIDVESRLLAPSGQAVIAVDRYFGDSGPERLRGIIEEAGEYTLEILAFERAGDPGSITVRFDALRPATDDDRGAAERLGLLKQAEELVSASSPAEAEPIYREVIQRSTDVRDGELWSEAKVRLASALRSLRRSAEARQQLEDVVAAEDLGEPIWQILALDTLSFMDLVDRHPRAAIQHVRQALEIPEIEELPLRRARLYSNLGRARQMQGAIQHALDAYRRAKTAFRPWDITYLPSLRHNLGVLHRHYLGLPETALGDFKEAAEGFRQLDDRRSLAVALNQIGACHEDLGETDEAKNSYDQALKIRRELKDRCAVANTLIRLALLEDGAAPRAPAWASEARTLVETEQCFQDGQAIRSRLATFAERRGDIETARDDYRRNLKDAQARGHRSAEVDALVGLARVLRQEEGCPEESMALTSRAMTIVEALRAGLAREDFRLAFGSRTQALFELHIDLQWQCGESEAALETAEKARARALLDRLRQIDAEVGAGADRESLRQIRQLRYQLRQAENERLKKAYEGRLPPDDPMSLEIDALVERLNLLEAEIGRDHPAYFRLMRAQPASLEEIQSLLDDETALVIYRLGVAHSYLWLVTDNAIEPFELKDAGRTKIENLAGRGREYLKSRASQAWSPRFLDTLVDQILPLGAMSQLARKQRWLVVADGVLELIPFAALPNPGASPARPLIVDHEIIHLPSASTWVELRTRSERRSFSGLLAAVADPVYGLDDPRSPSSASTVPTASGPQTGGLPRLTASGREADAILTRVPKDVEALDLRGFDAHRAKVISDAFRGYRMVHLAVHGRIHPRQPALSYLALAEWDRAGQPLDGKLFAHELYGLALDAELVVLAACDTGLGAFIPGEGLVSGLARGFLYAGSRQVIVSLWQISDHKTSELMPAFYARVFDGDDPVLALHEAQREMYRAGAPPYAWAGFVLQGG